MPKDNNNKRSQGNEGGKGRGGSDKMRNEDGTFTEEGARHFGRLGGESSRGEEDDNQSSRGGSQSGRSGGSEGGNR